MKRVPEQLARHSHFFLYNSDACRIACAVPGVFQAKPIVPSSNCACLMWRSDMDRKRGKKFVLLKQRRCWQQVDPAQCPQTLLSPALMHFYLHWTLKPSQHCGANQMFDIRTSEKNNKKKIKSLYPFKRCPTMSLNHGSYHLPWTGILTPKRLLIFPLSWVVPCPCTQAAVPHPLSTRTGVFGWQPKQTHWSHLIQQAPKVQFISCRKEAISFFKVLHIRCINPLITRWSIKCFQKRWARCYKDSMYRKIGIVSLKKRALFSAQSDCYHLDEGKVDLKCWCNCLLRVLISSFQYFMRIEDDETQGVISLREGLPKVLQRCLYFGQQVPELNLLRLKEELLFAFWLLK